MAQESRGILAQGRAATLVERAAEDAVIGLLHGFDEHAAHAAAGACDTDAV
jgi:hypothetical protein